MLNFKTKPFLKWAGGKTQLLPTIIENFPNNFEGITKYVEPFVGAGAVFLYLASEDSFDEYIINDINHKLINLYLVIRDNCEQLMGEIKTLKDEYMLLGDSKNKEDFYYKIRDEFNVETDNTLRMAALFLFLNKTCFNGIYRENSLGKFNVPFGKQLSPIFYKDCDLRNMSKLLNIRNKKNELKIKILNTSYENLHPYIDKGTFVYFDPPYRPVTENGFNSYNKGGFNDDSQINLRDFYASMDGKGAKLMLSNSDPKVLNKDDTFFDSLYEKFRIQRVDANRMINSNGSGRSSIKELLICNYEVKTN